MHRTLALALIAGAACALPAAPATAEMIGGNPGPQHNYVCPNADGKPALDCYFDAVNHLYTMCKHVKGIELIEFGYEKSMEGTNAAKSEYCLNKQKLNMTRPYQGALKEATVSKQAVDGVRALYSASDSPGFHVRSTSADSQYSCRLRTPSTACLETVASFSAPW
jgi:hypothetical protein